LVRDLELATLPEGGKARRVYLQLRAEIGAGALPAGTALPGESRLAERYGVSRVTVRRALTHLVAEGLIARRAGAGSVVTAPAAGEAVAADMTTLIPQIVRMGRETTARLLSFSYGPAPSGIAAALGLAPGARVQGAVRVRLADGTPFSHLTTHVPEEIASAYSEADLATTPLFALLERGGVTVHSARQTVSATLAAPDIAEALGVAVGAPLLALTRLVRDDSGRGVEHLSAFYRPDLFRLEMELARVGEGAHRQWEPVIGAVEAGDSAA
jgi:GntR family transcriptional regulator